MRPHQERKLWFGEPDFSCWFHRTCSSNRKSLIQPIACFFVASTAQPDLLFCAKHLLVAAMVAIVLASPVRQQRVLRTTSFKERPCHGFGKQILGADEQVPGQDQSD